MNKPLSVHLYRLATRLAAPASNALLSWRRARGKEDASRLDERRGVASLARPEGGLVWLHGASVGEGLSLLPLIEKLTQRGLAALLTTGTATSAHVLSSRLPGGAVHQFIPLDAPQYMRRFLAHWRPDVILIAESELWPNLVLEASERGAPIALVNARMSARSYGRWLRASNFIGAILARVDLCLAQTFSDAQRLTTLGAARVEVAGNLKFDAAAPSADRVELAALSGLMTGRPGWVAASTHEGEELIAARAHQALAPQFPGLLTMIAPRHPHRGPQIAETLRRHGLCCALRSQAEDPAPDTEIYICDSIGELGLFYRLAGIVFLGGSLAARGGQNPIEPAKLGNAILHGPNVANFVEVYRLLDRDEGAVMVRNQAELIVALAGLFEDGAKLRAMARTAAAAVESQSGCVARTLTFIEPWLAAAMARTP